MLMISPAVATKIGKVCAATNEPSSTKMPAVVASDIAAIIELA